MPSAKQKEITKLMKQAKILEKDIITKKGKQNIKAMKLKGGALPTFTGEKALMRMTKKQLKQLVDTEKLDVTINKNKNKKTIVAEIIKKMPKLEAKQPEAKKEEAKKEPEAKQPEAKQPEAKKEAKKEEAKKEKKPYKTMETVGHTIVNVYCGGSSHPDFPVPQSVVRKALEAEKLPPKEKKVLHKALKKIDFAKFEGIPSQVIPEPVPHSTHKLPSTKSRFSVPSSKKTKTAMVELEEEASEFEDDDDEIEETAQEKAIRLRKAELAKVAKKGEKTKGKKDRVKSKLEGIFAQRLPTK
jgi:hypothetical protein